MDLSALRIAMLGPIAWRTPPRHYGVCSCAQSPLITITGTEVLE